MMLNNILKCPINPIWAKFLCTPENDICQKHGIADLANARSINVCNVLVTVRMRTVITSHLLLTVHTLSKCHFTRL